MKGDREIDGPRTNGKSVKDSELFLDAKAFGKAALEHDLIRPLVSLGMSLEFCKLVAGKGLEKITVCLDIFVKRVEGNLG